MAQVTEVGNPQDMWQQLKRFWLYWTTSADLNPDRRMRRRVNRVLRTRPALPLQEWFEYFWQPREVSLDVAAFVYRHLEKYSGLPAARILPSDRLEEDLHLTWVCAFDWHWSLCDDFYACFDVDISDRFFDQTFDTVEDFMLFLNCQVLPVNF